MAYKYKILIAEDDTDILELLKLYLENENYEVILCEDGEKAYHQITAQQIDLAILDIMMPKLNGYELTKKIREINNMPIIILSAKNMDSDKILGLNIGADDYLTKPFNPLEIIARVRSNLRRYYQLGDKNVNRSEREEDKVYIVGRLRLDMNMFTLQRGDEKIILTPAEYKILELLMRSPGRVFTKVQIYEQINGEEYLSDDSTIMVHISNLREKIEENPRNPEYIKTIRGIGYKIEKWDEKKR